ncbi:MAG: hypothetical protein LUD51_02060 [Clostridia bacterium]|nr:hypothetical protein [Clostridia bacterium]
MLDWIINQERVLTKNGDPVDLSHPDIHKLLARETNVPLAIKNASNKKGMAAKAKAHMKNEVVPKLSQIVKDDMLYSMNQAIQNDDQMKPSKKKAFNEQFLNNNEASFLAALLLCVLQRENKYSSKSDLDTDFLLLQEVGFSCPLCGRDFCKSKKGEQITDYSIVTVPLLKGMSAEGMQFMSTGRDSSTDKRNSFKLALCRQDANEYECNPSEEHVHKLNDIKARVVKASAARQELYDLGIEDGIVEVIRELRNHQAGLKSTELSMHPLTIERKLDTNDTILIQDVKDHVFHYYDFIRLTFSDMDGRYNGFFDKVATEIKLAYMKIEDIGLSQSEILDELTDFINVKTELGKEYAPACRVIVSFFIQNCEVFHEVSE